MIIKAQSGTLINSNWIISLAVDERRAGEVYEIKADVMSGKDIVLGEYNSKAYAEIILSSICDALINNQASLSLQDCATQKIAETPKKAYSVEDLVYVGFPREEAEKVVAEQRGAVNV